MERRVRVIEDPNDPRYGEYEYEDTNADPQGNLPTEDDYQPPDTMENSTTVSPLGGGSGSESEPWTQVGLDPTQPGVIPWEPLLSSPSSSSGSQSSAPSPSSPTLIQKPAGQSFKAASLPTITTPKGDSDLSAAAKAAIMKLLATPLDVDEQALYSSPQNRAHRLAAQRAEERQIAQQAELAAAEGWSDSGGFDTTRQGIRTARGESEQAFIGQLAISEMQAQREMFLQGIELAESTNQFQKSQELQVQLAQLDAALRQAQMAEAARQYDLSLGFDYTQLGVNANQAAADRALGF